MFKFLKSSYQSLKSVFAKSLLGQKLRQLFGRHIDEQTLEELEAILYEADLGVELCQELVEGCRQKWLENPSLEGEDLIQYMKGEVEKNLIKGSFFELLKENSKPCIFLVIGVNGSGKTTSIAKISYLLKQAGKEVILGAADTYRAAASAQLEKWSEKIPCQLVKSHEGADPASVAFDTVEASYHRQVDVAFIDTAGRLHNRQDLMEELKKIKRVCTKRVNDSQIKTLLVLDAHTGQNSVSQVKTFQEAMNIDGLILSKMDGSAKGGSVVALCKKLQLPLFFLGTGEGLEDIQAFEGPSFVKALFD